MEDNGTSLKKKKWVARGNTVISGQVRREFLLEASCLRRVPRVVVGGSALDSTHAFDLRQAPLGSHRHATDHELGRPLRRPPADFVSNVFIYRLSKRICVSV